MDAQHKALSGLKITDATEGKVSAVFSTLNVKDSDGDVTLPGAFSDGAKVRISAYNHESWKGALPVGKGVIREDGDRAVLDGEFFMDTQSGRDTFEVVKQMGDLQEWSYGYDVVDADHGEKDGEDVRFLKALKVHEVSPVILGAGVGTHTLAVKSKLKLTDHLKSVVTDVDEVTNRVADVVTKRTEQCKTLGDESADLLKQLDAQLVRLKEVLTPEPDTDNPNPEAELVLIRTAQILQEV